MNYCTYRNHVKASANFKSQVSAVDARASDKKKQELQQTMKNLAEREKNESKRATTSAAQRLVEQIKAELKKEEKKSSVTSGLSASQLQQYEFINLLPAYIIIISYVSQ